MLTLFSRRWQRVAIAVFLVNWIAVFCFLPNHAWRTRKYDVPIKSPWLESVKDGRYLVISRSPVTFVSNEYLERNFSDYWGTDNLLGYEPLVPRVNATVLLGRPMTYLERFAGSYNGAVDQSLLDTPEDLEREICPARPQAGLRFRETCGGRLPEAGGEARLDIMGRPEGSAPCAVGDASADAGPAAGIRWVEHINSIDVDLSQWPGRELIFAFAANRGLETCIAGHCSPVGNPADGLIRVDVPPGTRHVRLVYHNALFLPSVIIALVTLMVYGLLLFRSRRANRKGADKHDTYVPVTPGQGG